MTTAREVVKVMVDVRLLMKVGADEATVGAPVAALSPAEEPKVAEKFTFGVPLEIEEELRA